MIKIISKKRYQSLINELESIKKENELLKKDPISFEDLKQKRELLVTGIRIIDAKLKQINDTFKHIYHMGTHRKLIKN